jgi:uncharacterized protein YggE
MDDKKTIHHHGKVGTVVVFFLLLFVFAKWGPAINFSSITQTRGEPFIVSAEGKVSVTPDIAKVTLGIEQTGQTLKQVQSDVNIKSKTLTDAIKKLGIEEKDIKTTSYNVYPQYDYTSSVQRITGYQASTTYEVTIRDFDKVNQVLVEATNAGANTTGGINFEVNDVTRAKKLQEAREEAVAKAKEKAEGLAKAAGIPLGKIINIAESLGGNEIRPMYATSKDSAGGGIPTPADIQPGETEISVTISLSYEIR